MPTGGPTSGSGPVVVTGVSGAGKTTVGAALAERLGVPFLDADDLHSPSSIAKMRSGVPLDDDDRWAWLDRAGAWLAGHEAGGGVLACSALRRRYRDQLLKHAPLTRFVELTLDRAALEDRVARRTHSFMPGSLLASQLATQEPLAPDEPGRSIDAGRLVDQVVADALAALAPP